MTRYRRLVLMPMLAALAGAVLAGAGAVAQDDDDGPSMEPAASAEPMASIAPMASIEPMTSMQPMPSMEPGLSVEGAWARESMMAELAGAAFMAIHNSTGFDDALVGASSPAAAVVEIHQTTMAEDGTMGMAPVAEVPIPAGGDAVLEPGGYHLMLIELVAPLEVGQRIELSLEFATAAPQTVSVPVQAMGPMGGMAEASNDPDASDDPEASEDE
jgi:copper(I)-binding protein